MRHSCRCIADSSFLTGVLLLAFAFTLAAGTSAAQQRHPIGVDDLWAMGRVGDPQVSPDGKRVAYTVTYYSMEKNNSNSDIYIVSIDGGQPRRITMSPKADFSPRWSPDGRSIAFISTRDGNPQVYILAQSGGEVRKVTSVTLGASGVVWSPDGRKLLFVSDAYPGCLTDSCNAAREQARDSSKVKGQVFDRLMYRVWDHWRDGKVSHLFIINANGTGMRDLTPWGYDVPPVDLGGSIDYAFSPDGKEVCFAMNTDSVVTLGTNNDLFTIPVEGATPTRITINKANDNQPVYSPDGKYIAYRTMERPGFEADRYQLMLYDREARTTTNLTSSFNRSVNNVVWAPDGKSLYFTAQDGPYNTIYSVRAEAGETSKKVISNGFIRNITISPNGTTLVYQLEHSNFPTEIFRCSTDGADVRPITRVNADRLAKLEMQPLESFTFEGAYGDKVEGLIVKPPFFDEKKKYPVVFLVHGGPQGAWEDDFHYRWNAQMFAAPGYVVLMVNFHGSTGYGQKFTDAISGDWGGAPFEDLMKGLDYALSHYPYMDANRVAAAGASYGGYMINWIAGHTDRFKCLVSHDGMFNTASAWGTTDELWFNEWEFKGTPWTNRPLYEKYSPSNFAENFKTPTLVVHGQLDYRLDVSEGMQMFTTLQRHGIPSKFLYFPDEGHFVLKPQNALLWWNTVLGWIAEWTR